jgi:OTU domain-containing protein 6
MTYRRMAEQEMRAKPDDYLPYLADEETGDMMSPELFQEYLADMIDETKAIWGGQPEVAALASALKRPIVIYRATDAPLTLGEEHGGQPLTIAWHKHYIGLGAHYNAVVPAK